MTRVQEETLVFSATDPIFDRKHNRLLLLQKHGHRLTDKIFERFWSWKVTKRAEDTSQEIARIHRVMIGILSCVKITSTNQNATSATVVCSDTEGCDPTKAMNRIKKAFENPKAPFYRTPPVVTRGCECGPKPWQQRHHKT